MNIAAIEEATAKLQEQGIKVLNAFLLAENEPAHARRLLELMKPPQDAVVLDAGCGTGELARLMHQERPDLTFRLLNVSPGQLALCPKGMERIEAPYEATGLAAASVDVVLFAFSLCHAADWLTVLREAVRVLKPGGMVFVFDMARTDEGNGLMRELLQADAYRPDTVADVARRAGLVLEEARGHAPVVERLRDVFDLKAAYDLAFLGVIPATFRFTKMPYAPEIASAFQRHQRIGFQFSGGRDSTAALFELREFWDRMDVYHLDTGDQFPELRAVVDAVEKLLPKRIIRINGDVAAVREQHGLASDVVPVDNTVMGRMVSGRTVKIISRYECCARALMNPMHQRMLDDGITLLVRGQRDDEYDAPPRRSGDVEGGMEVLYPIQSWSAAQVQDYLVRNELPVAPFYAAGVKRAPECMGCTAWWDEGRAAYMRRYHPEAHSAYAARMQTIRIEIDRQYATLDDAPNTETKE